MHFRDPHFTTVSSLHPELEDLARRGTWCVIISVIQKNSCAFFVHFLTRGGYADIKPPSNAITDTVTCPLTMDQHLKLWKVVKCLLKKTLSCLWLWASLPVCVFAPFAVFLFYLCICPSLCLWGSVCQSAFLSVNLCASGSVCARQLVCVCICLPLVHVRPQTALHSGPVAFFQAGQ